jgi:hypothetical protein
MKSKEIKSNPRKGQTQTVNPKLSTKKKSVNEISKKKVFK